MNEGSAEGAAVYPKCVSMCIQNREGYTVYPVSVSIVPDSVSPT